MNMRTRQCERERSATACCTYSLGCFWLTVALIISGCSRSGFDSSVSGNVTLDGKTLGQGGVVFVPISESGNPSVGTIGRDGHYALKTANTPGLNSGKYRVSVSALDTPNPPPGVRDTTPAKQLVPEKYTNIKTSGIEYDVKSGSNNFNIDLSSK
jgi:hypothetical protein